MNLQPTIRIVNSKPIQFYSPQQIAVIVPPEKRLPAQKYCDSFKIRKVAGTAFSVTGKVPAQNH